MENHWFQMSLLNDSLIRDIETILGIDDQEGMETEVPMEISMENPMESNKQLIGLEKEVKNDLGIITQGEVDEVACTGKNNTQHEHAISEENKKETKAEKRREKETETQMETGREIKHVGEKRKNTDGEKETGKQANATQAKEVKVDYPLGYKKDNFLTRDLKSACIYVAAELAPRLRQVITKNRSKFEVLFQLADACNASEIRTCTNYNQGLRCGLGDCHLTHGYMRVHSCMLCWEGVWILAPHSLVNCPFIKQSFWETLEITNY